MNKLLLCLNICNGVDGKYSLYYNKDGNVVKNAILKVVKNFRVVCIVNDMHHKTDLEFNYTPPHLLFENNMSLESNVPEKFMKECKRLNPMVECHIKNSWSATFSEHLRALITNYIDYNDEIIIVGFDLALDIVPTALLLAQQHKNVKIYRDGIGSVSKENKYLFHYLNYMGIENYDANNKTQDTS